MVVARLRELFFFVVILVGPPMLVWEMIDVFFPATGKVVKQAFCDFFTEKANICPACRAEAKANHTHAVAPPSPAASAPTQPAVNFKTGPDGTVLAWRLNPPTTRSLALNNPTLLVIGAALLLLSVPAMVAGNAGGVLLALAGSAAVWFALGTRKTPIDMEPLPTGSEGYQAITSALRKLAGRTGAEALLRWHDPRFAGPRRLPALRSAALDSPTYRRLDRHWKERQSCHFYG